MCGNCACIRYKYHIDLSFNTHLSYSIQAMYEIYKRIRLDYRDIDERLRLIGAPIGQFSSQIQKQIPAERFNDITVVIQI